MKKIVAVFIILALMAGSFSSVALAQNPVRKLSRGLGNVFSGFLELPINIVDAAEEEGVIAAMTYGIVRGLAMSLLRTGVGAYETVTFLIPLPRHYEPILEPEFLMSDEGF